MRSETRITVEADGRGICEEAVSCRFEDVPVVVPEAVNGGGCFRAKRTQPKGAVLQPIVNTLEVRRRLGVEMGEREAVELVDSGAADLACLQRANVCDRPSGVRGVTMAPDVVFDRRKERARVHALRFPTATFDEKGKPRGRNDPRVVKNVLRDGTIMQSEARVAHCHVL